MPTEKATTEKGKPRIRREMLSPYEMSLVQTAFGMSAVGGDENARLDDASRLSGWDNVRWIGIDARVACASFCR